MRLTVSDCVRERPSWMLARVERLAAVLRKWLLCAIRRDGLARALAIGASTLLHTVA